MFTGVRFNGKHSYNDYGLILKSRPKIGMPSPKTISIDVPGSDGSLDLTEAVAGEVKYSNREIELEFGAMVERDHQAEFKSRLMDALHGQIMEVILDEDSEWYYRGRVTVEFEDVQSWRLKVTIKVDAEPYKQAINETVIEFNSADIESYIEIPLADNVSTVYYNSRFEFGTVDEPTGDFSLFTTIRVRWTSRSPRGDATKNPVITFTDADGHSYSQSVQYINLGEFFNASYFAEHGIDATKIILIDIQNVGGASIAGTVNYGKLYVFQNDRMTVCPYWEVESETNVPVLINGRKFVLTPGAFRDPELVLKRGANGILFNWGQNSPSRTVRLLTRKGRL